MNKKVKKAAEKIKMPEDMKQRIISAAELAEKNRANTDNDDYIDVVSSTERVDPRRHIIRTISAVAACAVLAGGIGTTGFLLHKNGNNHFADSDIIDTVHKTSPFGDFAALDYKFYANDDKEGDYAKETYASLSDFLNNFDWGEPLDMDPDSSNSFFGNSGMFDYYIIKWSTETENCKLQIEKNGIVSFITEAGQENTDGGYRTFKIGGDSEYKIDIVAFEEGIEKILGKDAIYSVESSDFIDTPFAELFAEDFNMILPTIDITSEQREKIKEVLNAETWETAVRYDGYLHSFNRNDAINPTLELIAGDCDDYSCIFNICEDNIVEYTTFADQGHTKALYVCDTEKLMRSIADALEGDCIDFFLSGEPYSYVSDGEEIQLTPSQQIALELAVNLNDNWYELEGEPDIAYDMVFSSDTKDIGITSGTVDIINKAANSVMRADNQYIYYNMTRVLGNRDAANVTTEVSLFDATDDPIRVIENKAAADMFEMIMNNASRFIVTDNNAIDTDKLKYQLEKAYKSGNTVIRTETYYIYSDGKVSRLDYNYESVDGETVPVPDGIENFEMNLDTFETLFELRDYNSGKDVNNESDDTINEADMTIDEAELFD